MGMVMLLLAYMTMLIAITAGAVGADVCQLYAETKNGNVAPAFERLLDRLGQNCTTFTDAYPQLETVRTYPPTTPIPWPQTLSVSRSSPLERAHQHVCRPTTPPWLQRAWIIWPSARPAIALVRADSAAAPATLPI